MVNELFDIAKSELDGIDRSSDFLPQVSSAAEQILNSAERRGNVSDSVDSDSQCNAHELYGRAFALHRLVVSAPAPNGITREDIEASIEMQLAVFREYVESCVETFTD